MSYYIGIMSGTSIDGVDCVLIQCEETFERLVAHHFTPFDENLREQLLTLQQNPVCSLEVLGHIDCQLADVYSGVTHALLKKANMLPQNISAIGCHGQTVFHSPSGRYPFSMQLGDPNRLAENTGIAVVADFRRMDMACGGQGAPLVPLFHAALFSEKKQNLAVINLGGIANSTLLRPGKPVLGFDHGPASCLMDAWIHSHYPDLYMDNKGDWAASGKVHEELLAEMLSDPYFKLPLPKSTGREYFSMKWINHYLQGYPVLNTEDIQATLCELTAKVVEEDMKKHMADKCKIYFCGGGTKNNYLMSRFSSLLSSFHLKTTKDIGIPVDCMEAAAFAWLAHCRIKKWPGNLPSVTGATKQVLAGGVYLPAAF